VHSNWRDSAIIVAYLKPDTPFASRQKMSVADFLASVSVFVDTGKLAAEARLALI